MGPPETIPAPPDYEFCRVPAEQRLTSKNLQRCNWVQALEGGLDSAHATILHASNKGDLSFLAEPESLIPRLEVERTGYGYWYTGIRTLGTQLWVRVYQYVMPATQLRGTIEGAFKRPSEQPRIDGHLWVPIDDEHTWVYNFMFSADPARPVPHAELQRLEKMFGRGPGDVNPDYSLKGEHLQRLLHRSAEAEDAHNFTGIAGVNTQDSALQEGMGRLVDRTQEHLGTSDRAIITMRQALARSRRRGRRGKAAARHRTRPTTATYAPPTTSSPSAATGKKPFPKRLSRASNPLVMVVRALLPPRGRLRGAGGRLHRFAHEGESDRCTSRIVDGQARSRSGR